MRQDPNLSVDAVDDDGSLGDISTFESSKQGNGFKNSDEILKTASDNVHDSSDSNTPLTGSGNQASSGDGFGEIETGPSLSLFSSVSMIIGMMIGGGIFASPGPVLEQTGSTGAALLMWIVSGLVSMCGGLAYSELGTLIRTDGGEQIYLYKMYGEFASFLFVWFVCMIGKPCGIAITASVFGTYFSSLFGMESQLAHQIVSASLILCLSVLNSVSSSAGLKLQNITTVLKVLALLFMIGIGFVFSTFADAVDIGDVAGFTFEGSSTTAFPYVNALFLGLWTFDGWNSLNFITSEVVTPEKTLPKAIVISLFVTMAGYVFANLAYFFTLSKNQIIGSNSIAVVVGNKIMGPFGGVLFIVAVAISCLGAANGALYTAGRLFRASAEASMLPYSSFFMQDSLVHGKRSVKSIPRRSIMFQGTLACLFVFSGSYEFLVRLYGLTAWMFYTVTAFGVLLLRRRAEFATDKSAYRAPTPLILIFILVGMCLIAISLADPDIFQVLFGCAVVFLTGIVTFVSRKANLFKSVSSNSPLHQKVVVAPYN